MILRNNSGQSITLSFVPKTIAANSEATIADSFAKHPLLIAMLAANSSLQVVSSTSTTSTGSTLLDALAYSQNLSQSNPAVTESRLTQVLQNHAALIDVHHSNRFDPSQNQKEALDASDNASGSNPFLTQTAVNVDIETAITVHETDTDFHREGVPSLTVNEYAAIHASTAPTIGNPMVTTSVANALVTAHEADADFHTPEDRPLTEDEVDSLAGIDAGALPSGTNLLLTSANSLSGDQITTSNLIVDESCAGTSGTDVDETNKLVDNADTRMTDARTPLAHASSHITGGSDIIADATGATSGLMSSTMYTDLGNATSHVGDGTIHVTSDEKDALEGTSGTPPDGTNKLVDNADTRLSDSRTPLTHASSHITGGSDIIADATGATSGLMSSTMYTDLGNATSHVGDGTIHVTSDEKDALEGTSGTPPDETNKLVDNADTRLSDSRTPLTHASSHITGGSDIIADATGATSGLMSSTMYTDLGNATSHVGDGTIHVTSDESDALAGIDAEALPNSTNLLLTSANALSGDQITTSNKIVDLAVSGTSTVTVAKTNKLVDDQDVRVSYNDCQLQFTSDTTITLVGLKNKKVTVNGEHVSLSSNKTLLYSVNLAAADGTDATTAPIADTLYYVYLANNSTSWVAARREMRLSATAPTFDTVNGKPMLATTGNGLHYAFIGWVITTTDGKFSTDLEVASFYNPKIKTLLLQTTVSENLTEGANNYALVTGLSKRILLPKGYMLDATAEILCKADHPDASNKGAAFAFYDGTSRQEGVLWIAFNGTVYVQTGALSYKYVESASTPTTKTYAVHGYTDYSGLQTVSTYFSGTPTNHHSSNLKIAVVPSIEYIF